MGESEKREMTVFEEIVELDIPEEKKARIVDKLIREHEEHEILLKRALREQDNQFHRAETFKAALTYFITDHNGELG